VRTIDSPANPTIRSVARLLDRRHRSREGRFIVEGRREAAMALAAGLDVEMALVVPELGAEPPPGVETVILSPRAFAKVSVRRHPDGLALVATAFPTGLERVEDHSLILVAEGMEKPGNIGAIMRTADAAGAAVVVASAVADVFNPGVIRASQGAIFTVPVAVADSTAVRARLEERVGIVVSSPHAADALWTADFRGPSAIVVGAEHDGVSTRWEGLPTVGIPMVGAADSLNASVAAAVLLFEAVRQRAS
jgi:RNA methyltransferase, TrmH family